MKRITIVTSLLVVFLLLTIAVVPASSISISNISQKNLQSPGNNDIAIFTDVEGDLKAKTPTGEWQDISVTASVGTKLDFKIDMTVENAAILVFILLPYIDGSAMFNYVLGSGSSIPFFIDDSVVIWGFTAGHAPSTITFKAKIKKTGTADVGLSVVDKDNEITDEDSISVTGKSGCCFPAGTMITMADRSQKPIEQVKVGDRVLSYDTRRECFTSWTVKMLGDPVHPVYNINNGLIQLTIDHPLYIKKPDESIGLGAVDAEISKQFITYRGDVLTLEVGDNLFTKDGDWIKVTSITCDQKPVQTYNILSYSGRKTFYANGILVYEEHPPNLLLNIYLDKILDHFQRLARLFQHPIFQKFT